MSTTYDCLVVGGRCAGAPLATHLARGGMNVLVVDSDPLPSDQPFSTHAIQPGGIELLDELSVGDKIRAVTPAVRRTRFSVNGAALDIDLAPGREMYCPRRSTLDPLLIETAAAAGATIRDETAVVSLLRNGDRVVGARIRHKGRTEEVRADVVVGADGRNSTVAKLVGAEEYLSDSAQRGGYWGYYPLSAEFESLPFQTLIEIEGTGARFAFRTDGDRVIAGYLDKPDVVKAWSGRVDENVRAGLGRSALTRSLVEDSGPLAPLVGLLSLRFYFRAPVGPGWALVGDAGLHIDPTPGYGITDALRDAKALGRALLDGRPAALELYWRERDVLSVPLYMHGKVLGALDYANPFNEMIIARASRTPSLKPRMRAVVNREISPFDMVPPRHALTWTLGALLRHPARIWPHFAASARMGSRMQQELAKRGELLEKARAGLQAP